jgi:hypothetical protein
LLSSSFANEKLSETIGRVLTIRLYHQFLTVVLSWLYTICLMRLIWCSWNFKFKSLVQCLHFAFYFCSLGKYLMNAIVDNPIELVPCFFVVLFILRQGLAMYHRLALNLCSSCLCLLSAGIAGLYHHIWWVPFLNRFCDPWRTIQCAIIIQWCSVDPLELNRILLKVFIGALEIVCYPWRVSLMSGASESSQKFCRIINVT